jgi:hypothetical protein
MEDLNNTDLYKKKLSRSSEKIDNTNRGKHKLIFDVFNPRLKKYHSKIE